MDVKIHNAETSLGREFHNRDLLWEALQAAGSPVRFCNGRVLADSGNKRLALVGDHILALVIGQDGLMRGDTPGQTQQRISDAVNNANLAQRCDESGLVHSINENPAQGRHFGNKTKADTVEAVIGAVYLDGGFSVSAAEQAMIQLGII